MASETVERERPSKAWIFYRDGEPYGIEAAHSHSVARFIAALLAQERPGEPVKLVDLPRKPPRVALSDFPEYVGEPSTTEGEREREIQKLLRKARRWVRHSNWRTDEDEYTQGALTVMENITKALALLAQPQEQEERIEGMMSPVEVNQIKGWAKSGASRKGWRSFTMILHPEPAGGEDE